MADAAHFNDREYHDPRVFNMVRDLAYDLHHCQGDDLANFKSDDWYNPIAKDCREVAAELGLPEFIIKNKVQSAYISLFCSDGFPNYDEEDEGDDDSDYEEMGGEDYEVW